MCHLSLSLSLFPSFFLSRTHTYTHTFSKLIQWWKCWQGLLCRVLKFCLPFVCSLDLDFARERWWMMVGWLLGDCVSGWNRLVYLVAQNGWYCFLTLVTMRYRENSQHVRFKKPHKHGYIWEEMRNFINQMFGWREMWATSKSVNRFMQRNVTDLESVQQFMQRDMGD